MRNTLIDTLATIVFFTIIASITELYLAGMEPVAVLKTRLIMIPIMVLTGRPYGLWRDWFFRKTRPSALWSQSLVDGMAFLSFQLPVYGVTLMIAGASIGETVTLLISTSFLMLIVSRPFGLFLDLVRKITCVKAH